MVNFKFNYRGKEKNIEVKVCDNFFSQARGLMFRKKSKPLLFVFRKKKNRAIHSFFCVPFVALWFNGNKIVDVKIINPWKVSIKPSSKFDTLLEIPFNDKNFLVFSRRGRKV